MATLDELTTPLTSAEIRQSIYDAIEALGVNTTSWKPGAVTRTIIAGTSIVLAGFSQLQAQLARNGFLELSEGDWLTVVARQNYNVERQAATFAAGAVTFDNTGGGVFAPGIGDVIVLNSTTSKTYRNTEAFTLAAFETGVSVNVEALESGTASNASPGDIDTLETVLLGVTVTNPSAIVGTDEQTDESLIEEALAKTGTLSPNGPADAYRFVAVNATTDDGTSAGVTRVTVDPDGNGDTLIFVANATGPLSGLTGDTTMPFGAVEEAIETQVCPLGITCATVNATALLVPVTYEIWVRSSIGLTVSQIETNIAAALSSFMSTQPIGGSRKVAGPGFVFLEQIEGVIAATVGSAALIDLATTLPAGDTSVAVFEAPVLGAVIATTNIVSI